MMDAPLFLSEPPEPAPQRLALPVPRTKRWQPLRLGLVELYHYDSDEFWFRDGHLLLRGNNGTGKSKVLSLTLPFLLDAHIRPSRIEPDGDTAKRMGWNLLMGQHARRTGYAWLEFGRVAEDGTAHYLTPGAGLRAVDGRPQVEAWYFIIEDAADAPRLNRDLWLTSPQKVVHSKERLREALSERGKVFETGKDYRRAVDERLFRLGEQRYGALMDTLIQLRQPQLSRKPDEGALSDALSEALPPLSPDLISVVADALSQLDDNRRHLEEYQALARAVGTFERRYRIYAGTRSRREAAGLRAAQTEFDNASRARNEAEARLATAESEEAGATSACDEAERSLARARARLDTLQSDPANKDANRLQESAREAEARRRALVEAEADAKRAEQRSKRETEETRQLEQRVGEVESRLVAARGDSVALADTAGMAATFARSPMASAASEALLALTVPRFEEACAGLRALATGRRKDMAIIRSRLDEVARAGADLARRREARDEQAAIAEAAAQKRERADAAVDAEGERLIEAWDRHLAGLRQLRVDSAAAHGALAALAEWVRTPDGDNPARQLLQAAQREHSLRSAQRRVALDGRRQELENERTALDEERDRLESGADTGPPVPYTRAAEARATRGGAPLWQLVDFAASVGNAERAGLEAALEASGLLDAWLSPDGRLQAGTDGTSILDVQALPRTACREALGTFLQAVVPDGCEVPAATVSAVLAGIACAAEDAGDCEAWVAPDGRFRLGALAGAWAKPEAVYIGFAARAAARARRLAAIAERLQQLAAELAEVGSAAADLERDEVHAAEEWRLAPADDPLRQAHVVANSRAADAQAARERLAEADIRYGTAEEALRGAQQALATDAADLGLPPSAEALPAVEDALDGYLEAQAHLCQVAGELRHVLPELQRERGRERDALDDLSNCNDRCADARIEAEQADERQAVLRASIGAKVEELQRRLSDARNDVTAGEERRKQANERLRTCVASKAVAGTNAETARQAFERASAGRAEAVANFQRFATTGLLQAAWPTVALPDLAAPWTIDPALTLARSAERELSEVRHDDDAWNRVQKEVAGDATELQRALSARGHRAQVESTDWGLVVNVLYQGKAERPDSLKLRLEEEIAERNVLLTAKEREILENHLQTEIAYEIQRLVQEAERQRNKINEELRIRPTSTGVKYRLLWQPLTAEEGAPIGLEEARKRLIHTGADLWTAEDRNVVGTMLQRRIAAERERADTGGGHVGGAGGGTLAEQLARALDYRRWHRFRVERWQDGSWRKLSGPASSGERALGLTVPLFAAVASFYSDRGAYELAPRLMLLDEAFAGIDDAARAHCMGLIRAFDLDFMITSEREWACYAELPGVSICQLQRKEGIDAIYVSRWTWDGKARTREPDPDRRFAPS
ncbi:MAG TPA: TIGR02680 family protein [Hyphomicrobiaceae bacterium]